MTRKAHSTARGLASLGRHGDSTLVHMSPREVQGLQNLAVRHGTTLTVNPKTGLPEAFNLGSLLPMVAGLGVGIVAPWALPWVAAGTTGVEALQGKDIGQAALDGLGVYTGGQTAAALGAAGAEAAAAGAGATGTGAGVANAANAAASTGADAVTNAASQLTSGINGAAGAALPPVAPATDAITASANQLTAGVTGAPPVGAPTLSAGTDAVSQTADTFANTGINAPGVTAQQEQSLFNQLNPPEAPYQADLTKPLTADQLSAGRNAYMDQAGTVGERASDVSQGVKGLFDSSNKAVTFGNTLGSMNTAAKAGALTNIAQGFIEEPEDTTPEKQKPVYYIRDPKTGKPLYSQGTVNPNVAKLGYVPQGETYFQGAGFNPGVYSYSYDKYEPVENMRSGGKVGIRHLLGGGATSQDTAKNIVANSGTTIQPQTTPNQMAMQSANQYFQNQAANAPSGPMMQAAPSSQAMNDYLAQGNQMITPVARPAGGQALAGEGTDTRLANLQTASNKYDYESAMKDKWGKIGEGTNGGLFKALMPGMARAAAKKAGTNYVDKNGQVVYQGDPGQYWTGDAKAETPDISSSIKSLTASRNNKNSKSQPMADRWGNIQGDTENMAAGGLAGLHNTYKAGGKLLRGPGDGMSDSIPAVIGGRRPQRAALADGEFVVPADVVSHLGNGSTEAGSRKLYAMMDKVRHARTGRKKQAKAIKAERYMPR